MRGPGAIQAFSATLQLLESVFRQLEGHVPPPIRKPWKDGFVFRYQERTIHQAIVQKLARSISGLHAIEVLLLRGLFQEQGMVQRALDEIDEDIQFLSLALINADITPLHTQYLDYFFAEEFEDPNDLVGSHASRGMIRREKIRSYVNGGLGGNAPRANVVGRLITKAYSGFVHAASPHIMDMYGGLPGRFDVSGEFRDIRNQEHADDALNYFFRALASMAFAAKAFGEEDLFSELRMAAGALQDRM